MYLRSIKSKDKEVDNRFPFSLPVIRNLTELSFSSPVVFFVGENGSGKSTLLEAIAVGMGAIAVGSEPLESDASLDHVRSLASALRFVKNRRPKRGFFFRAEDFFGFIKRVKGEVRELQALESEYDQKFSGYARMLTMGMARGQHSALRKRYGDDADAFSHGESFLNLLGSRIVPGGLYLLDEPETPLSPQRQLALLSMLKEMVEKSCQFIIATHSPIIMAFPNAQILSFDGANIHSVNYEEVEHVTLTRSFLNNPDNFLRRL